MIASNKFIIASFWNQIVIGQTFTEHKPYVMRKKVSRQLRALPKCIVLQPLTSSFKAQHETKGISTKISY